MVKYFIENQYGQWLTPIDEMGPTWTKNPHKAWAFDKLHDYDVVRMIEVEYNTCDVIQTMREEGLLQDCIYTEHEFINNNCIMTISTPSAKVSWIYMPGFDNEL